MVYRVYVEKKSPYDIHAQHLAEELQSIVGLGGLTRVRILNRYDVEGIDQPLFLQAVNTIFSEPPLDTVYYTLPKAEHLFAVEYLPGQFDQRAESAADCIQLVSCQARPLVRSAKVYLLEGLLSFSDIEKAKRHLVNPVEARPASLEEKQTLYTEYPAPESVPVLDGFITLPKTSLEDILAQYSLAMTLADLAFCQEYFQQEGRNPTLTELRVIDTYWSDHCRHTTFGTQLENITIQDPHVQQSYQQYLALRQNLKREEKPQTLMDIATIGAKALQKEGKLPNLDKSDEINACSVHIKADNNGTQEDWLLLFKNETHNHPTEIEPFGGAATCIGGAIRDPLANRGYVFGAMRVTGAANPLQPYSQTLPGKLPQRKIVTTAAEGYSSYGNQIGLATSHVAELYHPGYLAKRMEIGAVLGAVPLNQVRREAPLPDDIVILLGGRTGRDGCGGATGSSKAHDQASLATCGAEVQKGNAPVERKLQRLFRNPNAARLILRCNDFGAGGVAVAIGELADGLCIQLDAVPKKYEGLNATELAISESQERMAVVVRPNDKDEFIRLAAEENLEATPVATITTQPRLIMEWQGQQVVNLSRQFLNSNGAKQFANVLVPQLPSPTFPLASGENLEQTMSKLVSSLAVCSQKGLVERFDSTIGGATLLLPHGGKYQLTPAQALAMKLPVENETTTCAGMAFGGNPAVLEQNPHTGAFLAVVESIAKLAASGFSLENMYLTFQEYFERTGDVPARWGKPFAALLGALEAQMGLSVAAIGGKDSMSGSFEGLDVPPTLISFAVASGNCSTVTSPEFKQTGSTVLWLKPSYDTAMKPNLTSFRTVLARLQMLITKGKALSVWAVGAGGPAEGIFKMCLGNQIGFAGVNGLSEEELFAPAYGSFLVEVADIDEVDKGSIIGYTSSSYTFSALGQEVSLATLQQQWQHTLEPVFPSLTPTSSKPAPVIFYGHTAQRKTPHNKMARPSVFVPVFPGTNCEYDTAKALRNAGAKPVLQVIRNLTPEDISASVATTVRLIAQCQMIVLPGGFSGGDEPEGSAKLIAAYFRNPAISEAVTNLLEQRDGLLLGICNGFQALVKLGLLPYGKITPQSSCSPTLTFNAIGRHQSGMVHTKIVSNLSPWLASHSAGAVHTVPISHGEGRFIAPLNTLQQLASGGQIATQYVDMAGTPSMDICFNPNGSAFAVEGITSLDGRILGKMGHSERVGNFLYKNIPGNTQQNLFENGVAYFQL